MVASISFHTCARTLARAWAIRPASSGSAPTGSELRRTVESEGGSPNTSAWWAGRPICRMLVAPSAIATASWTSTTPRSHNGLDSSRANTPPSAAVNPA
jgi:hypothetical protein